MSPVVICSTPSFVTKIIVLSLLLYIPALVFTSVARRGRATLASKVVPLTLIPLLLSATGTGWSMLKLSGLLPPEGSRAAQAAGTAEALTLLVFGSVIAAIVSGAALISAYRSRHPAVRASATCLCASIAIAVGGWIAVKHFATIAIGR